MEEDILQGTEEFGEEEEIAEHQAPKLKPEEQIPFDIFFRENVDGLLDQDIGFYLAMQAIKKLDIGIPPSCTAKDLLYFLESLRTEEKTFTEETFVSFFGQCLNTLKTEFMFIDEEEDFEAIELTNDFIQERLSDLQQVEDSDFCFTFTSFCVQAAEIRNIEPILEYNQLTNIQLRNNLINDITPLCKMPRLKKLDLVENRIKSIKNLEFPVLETLNLSKNQLVFVENFTMPKLQDLNLSENKIFYVSPFAFSNCESLKSLNLSTNSIRELKENAFSGLTALKTLKLGTNSLTSLSYSFDKDLSEVTHLDISENPLETIQGLNLLHSLEVLDLHKTNLESASSLSPLFNLCSMKCLSLAESPIADLEDYRLEVIHYAPIVEEIDEQPVSVNERQDSYNLFQQRAEEERLAMEAALQSHQEEEIYNDNLDDTQIEDSNDIGQSAETV